VAVEQLIEPLKAVQRSTDSDIIAGES
jgi:hypothetical protein